MTCILGTYKPDDADTATDLYEMIENVLSAFFFTDLCMSVFLSANVFHLVYKYGPASANRLRTKGGGSAMSNCIQVQWNANL